MNEQPRELPSIRFAHILPSGLRIALIFKRQENRNPLCESSFKCENLTLCELGEYRRWRNSAIVPVLMSSLTPGEISATAEYGHEILKKLKK